ncbi:hypothetical protein ZIOFF_015212 [Zingiber officinale]|uniref:Uncharacterized protein n=1 Tax=Zingiber officinale TaxID=94328 RepID=A0A8J5HY99_ZINOF|nr:hypothetical protein ZIOFF_015212 [Zingiber officinale]
MVSNWRSRLFSTIKKVFVFGTGKRTAATKACKSFEESQEEITKEFEERKIKLEAKVLEIYQASDADIKYAVMPQHISCSIASYVADKFVHNNVGS